MTSGDIQAFQASERSHGLRFFIFSTIGVFNTLLDIVLYTLILNRTHNIIIANVIATSIALTGSYLLNSRFTFKAKKWTLKTFVGFVVVTVFGLWFLQTLAIYGLTHLIHVVPAAVWLFFGQLENTAKEIVPKLLATGLTFIWNYVWYNKVIFRNQPANADEALEVGDV